jgi:hypothetical protein
VILVLFAAATLAVFLVPLVVWDVSERRRSRIRNSIIESGNGGVSTRKAGRGSKGGKK